MVVRGGGLHNLILNEPQSRNLCKPAAERPQPYSSFFTMTCDLLQFLDELLSCGESTDWEIHGRINRAKVWPRYHRVSRTCVGEERKGGAYH